MVYSEQNLIDIKMQNYILNLNELLDRKIVLKSKPLSVQILLSNKCNLKCFICNFKDYHDGTIMDAKKIEKLLNDNPQLITVEWSGGGEPLMHPQFEYLLDLTHSLRIKQILITNGLLLTESIMEKIAKYNVNLILSVDGHSKNIYEKLRVNGNYDVLTENIKILNKYRKQYNSKGFLRIYYIVINENYKYLPDMLEFIEKNNIKEIFFKSDCAHSNFDIVSHGTIEIKKDLQRILKKTLEYADKKAINCMIDEGMRQILLLNDETINDKKDEKDNGFCLLPWQQVRILPKGEVIFTYFCCNPIGNINVDSLEDLWNSNLIVEYRDNILKNDSTICNKLCFEKNAIARTHSGMERFLHTLLI